MRTKSWSLLERLLNYEVEILWFLSLSEGF
ncbi:hypothetical protein [Methylomonas albis]|nr:hypothetical protein [Methylomonas albis]